MLAAILMRRLKVLQLLSQILNIRFQLRRLGRQSLVHFGYRAEDKPTNGELIARSRDHGLVGHEHVIGTQSGMQHEEVKRTADSHLAYAFVDFGICW